MYKFKNVAVGISGGVDSAVSALLLKQKGYNVQGVFMQNWDIRDENGYCSADNDYKDAAIVCEKLQIKLHHVNFVKEYWNEVFTNLLKEYQTGFTPNPDILCNKNIKFNYFYKYSTKVLKVDAIATGHYAKTSFGPYLQHFQPNERVKLFLGDDPKKDQTFFLCQIAQESLQRTMFPIGHLHKSKVKKIAFENNLEVIAKKKESMGICFIGTRNFQPFIRQYINDEPGVFIDVDTGAKIGEHFGIHQWTLGQRARLPGHKDPYFTVRKDKENNVIFVAAGTKHPAMFSSIVFTGNVHWIDKRPDELQSGYIFRCKFKFQHTQAWVDCQVCEIKQGLVILLRNRVRAVTPGQYAVLAKDGECLGSAKIINEGVTNFSLYWLQNNNIRNVSDVIDEYREKIETY